MFLIGGIPGILVRSDPTASGISAPLISRGRLDEAERIIELAGGKHAAVRQPRPFVSACRGCALRRACLQPLDDAFSFIQTSTRNEPARRFRKACDQDRDDDAGNSADQEHIFPTKAWDDERTDLRGREENPAGK